MGVERGESGLGTWFPLQQICLAAMFPKVLSGMLGIVCFERHSFFIAREWFAEQGPGGKTWACNLCGFGLGFWVKRDWGHGPSHWVRIQGPNGSGYHGAVH